MKNLFALIFVLFFAGLHSQQTPYDNLPTDVLPTPVLPVGLSEIKVVSATQSEYRLQDTDPQNTKYQVLKSFDNNLGTEYHSIKVTESTSTTFPVVLTYHFESASRINRIDYYPRTDDRDIDGHWKELIITVIDSNSNRTEVFNNVGNGFTQFNRAYSVSENFFYTIDLPSTYHDIVSVEFDFRSGQENMITVAEIDFWEPSVSQFDPSSIFSDDMYTELKAGIGNTEINAITDNEFFKAYALEILNDTYAKEYRVQSFKAYPHPSSVANELSIFAQSRCSNVTGIYLKKGEEIIVVSDQDLELLQVDFWPQDPDNPGVFDTKTNPLDDQQIYYTIKKGANFIKAEQTGLFYVQYWSDDYKTLPNANLHFMYGRVNGYFDGRVRSREEWSTVLNIAEYPYYDVIGEYAQLTFPLSGFKELTDNGWDLIEFYDRLNYKARFIHGHIDIPGREIPNHSHMAGVYKKYKYASAYAVFYNVSDANESWQGVPTLEKNFNYALLKDDFFGTVHEWGHTLQIRQAILWGDLTETTCNIAANYAWVEELGHENSKELNSTYFEEQIDGETVRTDFGSQYERAWELFFVRENSFADQLPAKMPMFWQLYLYNTKVLGNTSFYPKVHDEAIKSGNLLKEEDAMLNFTYLVAKSAEKDFTKFFEKWNFFKQGTYTAGDYGTLSVFEMTADKINEYKTKVSNLGYEAITDAVEYITDSNFLLFKNKTLISEGTYSIASGQLTPTNWDGVVAYENYLDEKLSNVYLNSSPVDLVISGSKQEIYAVQYDGSRKLVYTNGIAEDYTDGVCSCAIEQINQEALDTFSNDNSNNFLPVPSGLTDREWSGSTVTVSVADIEANFTAARNLDSSVYPAYKTFKIPEEFKIKVCPNGGYACSESEKIEKWFLLSIQEKGLFILNSERVSRGLPPFQGVSSEVSEIAQLYADALAQNNNGLSHNLPLTINGIQTTTPWERLDSNAVIKENSEYYGFAENLAYKANSPAESTIPIEYAIYAWNYDDSSSSWGHRNFNLSILNDNTGNLYEEGIVGFGIKKVVEPDGWIKFYTVMNAVDPDLTWDLTNLSIYCNKSFTNTKPTVSAISPSTQEEVSIAITLLGEDANANPLTYMVTDPSNGTVSLNGAVATYTPNANFNGTDSFTYTANDGTVDSEPATATITVTAVNDAPVLSSIEPASFSEATETGTLIATLSASDADGDTVTFSILEDSENNFEIEGNKVLLSNPFDHEKQEIVTVSIVASDGELTDTKELVVTVEDVPNNSVEKEYAITVYDVKDEDNTQSLDYTKWTKSTENSESGDFIFEISGGEDATLFTIDSETGALDFIKAPDYENPSDANRDNIYIVIVKITNVNDGAPEIPVTTNQTTFAVPEAQRAAAQIDAINTNTEIDTDQDGLVDIEDNCPTTYNPGQEDMDGDGIGDVCDDSDMDTFFDAFDICPSSRYGVTVDAKGCEVFSLPSNTFSVTVTSASCPDSPNGEIIINSNNTDYSYHYSINEQTPLPITSSSQSINNLSAGTYTVCITVDGVSGYQRCYTIGIKEPAPLVANSKVDISSRNMQLDLSGSEEYQVTINGKAFLTTKERLSLNLEPGMNRVEVATALDCQGVYFEEIFVSEEVKVYPNPTPGPLQLFIAGSDSEVEMSITSLSGNVIKRETLPVPTNRIIETSLGDLPEGLYLITLNGTTVKTTQKVIKQ